MADSRDEYEETMRALPVTETSWERERATKSVTVRMPARTLALLDSAVAMYESDRTEVIKRAVRLLSACPAGHGNQLGYLPFRRQTVSRYVSRSIALPVEHASLH